MADQEAPFQALLARHWPTLRSLDVVTAHPPLHYRGLDGQGKPVYVEIFKWTSAGAMKLAHEHPDVMAIWEPMGTMTEPRDGRPAMEFPHFQSLDIALEST